MKSSEVLAKAKGFIITYGWGQGDDEVVFTEEQNPPCCVATAISKAACDATFNKEMASYREARDWFISATDLQGYASIVKWNDAPERSKEEVLAAFDAAISLAQRKEAENADQTG